MRIASIDSDGNTAEVVPQETQEIPFPELPDGAEYLVSLFHSAGTATQTGMGLVPLSWQEIEAWVRCTGIEEMVTPWELETVRRMSEAYASEYSQAYDPKRKQPYQPVVDMNEVDLQAIDNKVRLGLSMFKKKQGHK